MTTVLPAERCVHPTCESVGIHAFASHPDDIRCAGHHDVELRRRIAAVEAARSFVLALVG